MLALTNSSSCLGRRGSGVRIAPPRPNSFCPITYRSLFSCKGTSPLPCLSLYEPFSREVFLRWQFAHLTSHFAISATITTKAFFWYINFVTCRAFSPRTWSNSKTTGSSSPQSTHGWVFRYSITNCLLRSRVSTLHLRVAALLSGCLAYEPLFDARWHNLQNEPSPSGLLAFLLNSDSSFHSLQWEHFFNFVEVNYEIVSTVH